MSRRESNQINRKKRDNLCYGSHVHHQDDHIHKPSKYYHGILLSLYTNSRCICTVIIIRNSNIFMIFQSTVCGELNATKVYPYARAFILVLCSFTNSSIVRSCPLSMFIFIKANPHSVISTSAPTSHRNTQMSIFFLSTARENGLLLF